VVQYILSTRIKVSNSYLITALEYNLEMVVKLPYNLRSRYASIAVAWTVIIIPPVFINLGLFYGLWYCQPEMDRLLGAIFHLSDIYLNM
jgi:hypothetical protein